MQSIENRRSAPESVYLAMAALLSWLAITGQLYLMLMNRTASIPETITRFFSFFTILTNLLVACCLTGLLLSCNRRALSPRSGDPGISGHFFTQPAVLAATTVYIFVVGLVYNLVLRPLWSPRGLQLIVDELLHSVIPLDFLLYWILFVPKKGLSYDKILPWLVYPMVYLVFILIRGAFSGFYPYPFIDITVLGYPRALLNALGLLLLFLFLSFMLAGLGRLMSKSNPSL